MSLQHEAALVVFSGGQDSATCLAWALNRFASVGTVGFQYGQRHDAEIRCREDVLRRVSALRPGWRSRLAGDTLLSTGLFQELGETALTHEAEIATGRHGFPTTFVPGRNLLFLAAAGACAYGLGVRHLVMGVCETDSSGYPDCRDDAVKAMQLALRLGMETRFVVHTPLMWLTKGETWDLAEAEGGAPFVELVREATHTCYRGIRETLHSWGYGCGECPACLLRAAGWADYAARSGGEGRG